MLSKSIPTYLAQLVTLTFFNVTTMMAQTPTNSEIGLSLDDIYPWNQVDDQPGLFNSFGVVNSTVAHKGDSFFLLRSTPPSSRPYIEKTVIGPGVARIWMAPRGSYRGSTQTTRMCVVGGSHVDVTVTGRFSDPIFTTSEWQLAELSVPSGSQVIKLECVISSGSPSYSYGYFDDFTFTPNALLINLDSQLEGQVGTAFSLQAEASGTASFAATSLPPGITINSTTGLISGIPESKGVYESTITATGTVATANKNITFNISSPLGEGLDQPTWTWRTSMKQAQAWRYTGIPDLMNAYAVETIKNSAEDSWIEADISGPGWISWKARGSTAGINSSISIAVIVDGVPVGALYAPPGEFYSTRKVWIPKGLHTVRWIARFVPTGTGSVIPNSPVRLDAMSFSPDPTSPNITGISYENWAVTNITQENLRQPSQDGDGDGFSNWSEYSFGNASGLFWPPAAEMRVEGEYAIFTSPYNPAAADCEWSFELLYPQIPNYIHGWSPASTRDKTVTFSGNTISVRISIGKITESHFGSVNLYTIEPFLEAAIGRFVAKPISQPQ
jgi:hypothetical protein